MCPKLILTQLCNAPQVVCTLFTLCCVLMRLGTDIYHPNPPVLVHWPKTHIAYAGSQCKSTWIHAVFLHIQCILTLPDTILMVCFDEDITEGHHRYYLVCADQHDPCNCPSSRPENRQSLYKWWVRGSHAAWCIEPVWHIMCSSKWLVRIVIIVSKR